MTSDIRASADLGDPPWDEDVLRRAYFRSFTNTRDTVRAKHLGASVYEALESQRLSLDVFTNSVADVIASINKFKAESSRSGFWNRSSRQMVEDLEIAIQRGVVSSSMCALSLVDHTRVFAGYLPIPNYGNKVEQTFSMNHQHQFIQSLRNYLSHVRIVKAHWRITHSREGRSVFFFINQSDLLKWDGWTGLARIYVDTHPEGINIEDLFDQYSSVVIEFHNWLRSAVMDSYGVQVSDYLRYQKLMNRFDAECHWNLLIKQVAIQKQLDPYMYLDRYLTQNEIKDVLSLPHRSKDQVDRIIELIDEYGSCTEEMRQLVYELFKIKRT